MLADYQRALADPDRLALTSELSLLDTQLVELVRSLDRAGSGRRWRQLRDAWEAFSLGQRQGDVAAARAGLQQIEAVLAAGPDNQAVWDKIGAVIERRRRVCESEVKREVIMRELIGVEQAMAILNLLLDSVLARVTNAEDRRAIAQRFRELVGGPIEADHIDC